MRVTPPTAPRLPIRTSTTGARVENGSYSFCPDSQPNSWIRSGPGQRGTQSSRSPSEQQNGELHAGVITSINVLTASIYEAVGYKLACCCWECLTRPLRREVFWMLILLLYFNSWWRYLNLIVSLVGNTADSRILRYTPYVGFLRSPD